MSTPYANLYAGLNPHLKPHATIVRHGHTYTCTRGPLRILCHEREIRDRICRTFETSSALFDTHTVTFPAQEREATRPIGGIRVIDVNYMWSTEYYHFFTEVLPNVLFLKESSPIYCQSSPFTVPLFRWFGVQNPVVSTPPRFASRIRAKYVECGNPSPEKIRAIRSVVGSKLIAERRDGILIHRQNTRTLLNEPEVLATLQAAYPELEWKIFDLPSIEETAELFSKAAIIVGPHGAGMTNMLFSSAEIPVVEFMPLEQPNICYWHLSELLGNKYFMIPCPSDQSYSMRVDCATLTDFLNQSVGKL